MEAFNLPYDEHQWCGDNRSQFFWKNKLRMEQLLIHLHHFRICYIIKFLQKLVKMLNFMLCIFYNRKKKIRSQRKTVINVTKNKVILESFDRLPLEDTPKCYSNGFTVMALNTWHKSPAINKYFILKYHGPLCTGNQGFLFSLLSRPYRVPSSNVLFSSLSGNSPLH